MQIILQITTIIMIASTFVVCFGGGQGGCIKAQATYKLSSGHCVAHSYCVPL